MLSLLPYSQQERLDLVVVAAAAVMTAVPEDGSKHARTGGGVVVEITLAVTNSFCEFAHALIYIY